MSKIIIYDSEKILIADLDRTETKREVQDFKLANVYHNEYAAIFTKFKIIHSRSLKEQLKKLEKILKYHKEKQ